MVSTQMMIQGRIFAIKPPAFTGLLGLNRLAVSVASWQSGAGAAHAAVQFFGLIENAFNTKYTTFGTFSPTSAVFIAQAPGATNPRSYSPAAPIAETVGIRVTF
jgi:hypothetical protein